MRHQLFVYGGLRQGKRWWPMLEREGAIKVDQGTIMGCRLFVVGDLALAVKGVGVVEGELMVVTERLLKRLDGVRLGFVREAVSFVSARDKGNDSYEVYTYLWPDKLPENSQEIRAGRMA